MATRGNALAGSLAAALQAIEIQKLVAGERENVAAGREVLLDARCHALVASRLVRSPACRFDHERWALGWTADLPLREALELAGGEYAQGCLFVADSAFVSKLVCARCGDEESVWRLRDSLDERARRCPGCGAARTVRGFDLVERIAAEMLPAGLLDRPLAEFGLRPGEVFGVERPGEPARYFALRDGEPTASWAREPRATAAARVVVAGLGNIGSFLVPQLARMAGVASVVLCDPDVYEPHQVLGQDIGPDAVGRNKAEAQAERLRALRPELRVEAFAAPVEMLPLGAHVGAVTASCLDTKAARLRLAARAWRVGSPFVDAAVGGGESLLARTSVYLPEEGAPCFECAFDAGDYAALEQVHPCERLAAGASPAAA